MSQEEGELRGCLVAGTLAFTEGTHLQASLYKRLLLAQYAKGQLTLQQVEALLAYQQAFSKEANL